MRMIVIFHIDDYRVVYYTIIMAVYFTEIIYNPMLRWIPMIGFNEINHLFISLHPSFVLCHS